MKKRLLLSLFIQLILSHFLWASEDQCGVVKINSTHELIEMYFEIPKANKQIKLVFSILGNEKTDIEDLFYCMLKENHFNCVGDDDGGSFTLYPEERTLSITRIGSGNPDKKRIELKASPKTPFHQTDCQKLRSVIKK